MKVHEYSIGVEFTVPPTSIKNAIAARQAIANRLADFGYTVTVMGLGGGLHIEFNAKRNPYSDVLDILKEFNICSLRYHKID